MTFAVIETSAVEEFLASQSSSAVHGTEKTESAYASPKADLAVNPLRTPPFHGRGGRVFHHQNLAKVLFAEWRVVPDQCLVVIYRVDAAKNRREELIDLPEPARSAHFKAIDGILAHCT